MISATCLISVEVSGEVSGIQNYDTSNATFVIGAAILPGPLCHYKMNDAAANTNVDDSRDIAEGTLSSNVGNNTENISTEGKINGALDFNGTDDYAGDYVECGTGTALDVVNAPFSISVWIYPHVNRSQMIAFKGSASQGWLLVTNRSGGNDIDLGKGGICDQSVGYTFSANTWYHIVAVQNFAGGSPSYVEYYINGEDIGGYNETTPYYTSAGVSQRIGGKFEYHEGGTLYDFDGKIDDFRLYNFALNQTQIDFLYNSGNGTEHELGEDMIPPVVTIEAPATGYSITGGTQYLISWEASDNVALSSEAFTIWFSSNEGTDWAQITSKLGSAARTYSWNVPSMLTNEAMISIEAADQAGNIGCGISGTFEITGGVPPVGNAPTIEAIRVNGRRFRSGDIISSTVSLDAVISRESSGVTSAILYIDGVQVSPNLVFGSVAGQLETWHIDFKAPPSSQRRRVLIFRMEDLNGVGINTVEARVYGGTVQMIGRALNFPNPFQPMSDDPGRNTTSIQYVLTVDARIHLIIYDITGHEVKRMVFSSGENGGRGGTNQVTWNGRSMFGEPVGNGMYIYKIISGNEVIGSGKFVVLE
jgi:hypothetical protein